MISAGLREPSGVVVQVRLGSTRLPRKALLPLGGATMTDQVLARLAFIPADFHILATDEASTPELAPIARRHGFELLTGPAEDVLARYCLAIRRFGLELVIRATGDNPLVSHELAILLLERGAESRAQYTAFSGTALGMGVELVEARALLRAEAEATAAREREHVCPYLYDHPEIFRILRPEVPRAFSFPEGRVTVDTFEDYEAVLSIYGALYDGRPIPTERVLSHLRGENAP